LELTVEPPHRELLAVVAGALVGGAEPLGVLRRPRLELEAGRPEHRRRLLFGDLLLAAHEQAIARPAHLAEVSVGELLAEALERLGLGLGPQRREPRRTDDHAVVAVDVDLRDVGAFLAGPG